MLNLRPTAIKIDPYLNVDAGTLLERFHYIAILINVFSLKINVLIGHVNEFTQSSAGAVSDQLYCAE
jgi:CTP synthase (UTP-ammonia lyase)